MSEQMLPIPTMETSGDATPTAVPFPSLGALRTAHNALLDAHREQGDTDALWQEVAHFLLRGRATGALLDREDDHWAAQSLLDYWSATGYSIGRAMPDAVLDEFDPTLAPEIPDEHCPYVGLAAFREGQRPYFFGRQQLVETLVTKVTDERLLAVVGPSGSGKSSVVLAGFLPILRGGALAAQGETPASDQWRYSQRMVPGSDPLVNLEQAILPRATDGPIAVTLAAKFAFAADGFRREPDYLVKLINATGDVPFVLVIDQFEELFTLCTDDVVRRAFIDNLLSLVQTPSHRHTVILTMRTDFESFVARLPNFQPAFEAAIVRVTPLNASELRAVIERPATLVGLKFEEGVVDALVQDVLGEPAALPLLQFTLLKLWETRERNRITWASYKALGGGRLALSRSADRLYENLIPEEQVTARRILLRLVRPGDGLEITSNRVRRAVLYQTGEAHDRVDRVLTRLVEADLLRLSPGEKPEDAQIEVAHEALVRNWPRLVGWLEDERGRIRERLRLTEAAEQWLKLDRDAGALLRGTLLEDAQRHPDLNELEEAYVQASLGARAAALAEHEAARQRELDQAHALAAEQQQRADAERQWAEYQTLSAAKLRQRALLLVLTTVAALALAGLAIWLGYRATEERNNALNQEATAVAAAASADIARQAALAQAATANAERAIANAARAVAEAEKATAEAAEAEIRAEQTRVRHLQDAIAFAQDEFNQTPQPGTAVAVATPIPTVLPGSTPVLTPGLTPGLTPTLQSIDTPQASSDTTTAAATTPAPPVASPTSSPTLPVAGATVTVPVAMTAATATATVTMTAEVTLPITITATPAITSTPVVTVTITPTISPIISPSLIAIFPEIDVPLYAEPNEKGTVIETLRAPTRLPVLTANSFWVQVGLSEGKTGWVQAWLLTFGGEAKLLPLELRYLVVSEALTPVEQTSTLPFTYGTVISLGGADGDFLLDDPNNEQSGLIWVPVGTNVTLLREVTGSLSYGSGIWYYVSVVDPNGKNVIHRGYLPAEVLVSR